MGYTHYWNQKAAITPENWAVFTDGCKRLFELVEASGVSLNDWSGEGEDGGRPTVNGKEVSFNGTGEAGFESFRINRSKRKDAEWLCKTARKAYDIAVAAILIYLDSIESEAFETDSDGAIENYRDALTLARQSWPTKANQLDFPRSLRDKARFARYLDSSTIHEVARGHDDVLYIENRRTRELRRLPANLQGDAFSAWVNAVPHAMRKWGSFSANESTVCARNRLGAVWALSEGNQVPSLSYDLMTHGMMNPEITRA